MSAWEQKDCEELTFEQLLDSLEYVGRIAPY